MQKNKVKNKSKNQKKNINKRKKNWLKRVISKKL